MNKLEIKIKERYCTYTECANEIGVSESSLRGYIKGRNKPSWDTGRKLAETLGVSLDELDKMISSS